MSGATAPPPPRRVATGSRRARKPATVENAGSESALANGAASNSSSPNEQPAGGVERTVKKLRLSKALTIPERTTVSDACRRMAQRKVDAVLLTGAKGLLSGIVTDKDIVARVVAEGLKPEQTAMSKVMTKNPAFVTSDTLAIDALQRMVQGKFRHLPVVENGEVIAMLDITKCIYDAIFRMEKAAEQGNAIAAAVEGVERQWGSNFSAQYSFIETLRDRMFKPSLSSIISENSRIVAVLPSDPICLAAKRMRDNQVNSVLVMNGDKPQGILTSKDVLMRVVAHSLSPELTLVEKIMTAKLECATVDTAILDALRILHDGKFLHLPVVDHDGCAVACLDVLHLTDAAISMVDGGSESVTDETSTMMQKFWDSALALDSSDDPENHSPSEVSALMTSEGAETGKSMYPPLSFENSFSFKFQDTKGNMHRISCGVENLGELLTAVTERAGAGIDQDDIQLLYEDDEGDRILLLADRDLSGAVNQARLSGLKALRLHVEILDKKGEPMDSLSDSTATQQSRWTPLHTGLLAGTVLLTGVGVMVYLKRSSL